VSSDTRAQVSARSDGAGVVDAGGFEVLAVICSSRACNTLFQAIALASSSRTILDHLSDGGLRTWVLDSGVVASSCAVVALHETWVAHTVVGSGGSNASVGFLDDNCENETGVDASGCGDGSDGALDVADFIGRGVGNIPLSTAVLDVVRIGGKKGIKTQP